MTRFYPRLYVHSLYNAGLSFALLFLLFLLRRICSELCIFDQFHTMLSAAQHIVPCNFARKPCPEAQYQIQLKILHYCPISPCFQHIAAYCMQPCPPALPGSLARQPCQEALPASLARQPSRKAVLRP
jgi:hypothetical protein